MAQTGLDTRRADAAYRSFPSFAEWRLASIDTVRWERYAGLLEQRAELTPALLARAREVAKRAAAVDTGAIEGLYQVDRGFTFSVAMQMAAWEAQLDAKGARVRSLIEAQLGAYDFVLDFATQAVPVAEAWIRTLHEVMCQGQETYSVYTEIGLQEQPLPIGRYKVLPNHVLKADGVTHAYAPVDLVPAEMQRFCEQLRSDAFTSAHPVLQASYAHYAFVVIHPFADGNGRVARALASVFTYRASSLEVPLDSGREDDLVLRCVETREIFESRISEAHPMVTGTLHLRLAVFVHGLLGHAITEIARLAAGVLRPHS